jgi:hypothetical protein
VETASYLDTLAAAYAEAGRFEEAVRWQEKALADPALAKQVSREEYARCRQRLDLYKQRKPYRDREE